MNDLDTYNRVRLLESSLHKNLFSTSYILLVLTLLASLADLLLFPDPWPYDLQVSAAALLVFIALVMFDYRRSLRCQYCGDQLGYVTRPFLLTQKYLAMHGVKKGDYFYTRCRWGSRPLQQRWAKISHRSAACHHCRLSEEKHLEYFEEVSAEKQSELESGSS